MDLFAPSLAFVDLETTGTHAAGDRITEVGIVRVDADAAGGPPRVHEWSTLIDPEVPIPAVIQALTGITDAMVAGAPTFSAVAGAIEERIADCVFVAHNARFDHGFLKHAYARDRPSVQRAAAVHGAPVAPPVSGSARARTRRDRRAARHRRRAAPPRAGRRARDLGVRRDAVPRRFPPRSSPRPRGAS